MARDIFKSMSLFTPKEALQVSAAQGQTLELVKQSSQSWRSTQAAKLKLAQKGPYLIHVRMGSDTCRLAFSSSVLVTLPSMQPTCYY